MRDARLTPARPDLAAAHLKGEVEAAAYAEGTHRSVSAPVLDQTALPDPEAPLINQLLYGERFTAYEIDEGSGYAWGQAEADGYVGYVPLYGLGEAREADARVVCLGSQIYPAPEVKTAPVLSLPYLAELATAGREGDYVRLAGGGYVPATHVAPLDAPAEDFVAEAERLLGLPYLWGGRSPLGLDCSALVQLALKAAGRAAPRDSDMQESLGAPADAPLRRGDLVFWRGHVGIMQGETQLLHANAHHMRVVSEPLAEAKARIAAAGGGEVTARRRL